MARKIDELESELLELGLRDRAPQAKFLLESLDELPLEDLDRLWAEESEARYAAFLEGRTTAVDGDAVLARTRRKW